jgi:hypothetical protein
VLSWLGSVVCYQVTDIQWLRLVLPRAVVSLYDGVLARLFGAAFCAVASRVPRAACRLSVLPQILSLGD